ncbi:hypothetical protein [Streptomyces hydrogenans]|uniref:hypothetical protein n=1 Tax=Streptomyces hydrogenans TaxID=1873719 RepID=UPI00167DB5B9|nr:hypothetical protein [Streptomyces hydrogenans]
MRRAVVDDGLRDADLVVDATGRSSRLGEWLGRHDWNEAPVDRMRIGLGYATASFHRGDESAARSSPTPAPVPRATTSRR